MLGKMIGALVGDKVAKRYGENGALGAVLGAGAASLVRRAGPLGIAIVGGVAAVRYIRRHRAAAAAD